MSNQERNKDALIAHIHAQDTIIRNRNNRIAELEALLRGEEVKPLSEQIQKKIDKAYKSGWKDAYRAILWEVELKIATWERAIELIKGETK